MIRLALLVLVACGSRRPPPAPSSGVPPSIWTAPAMQDAGGCEPSWLTPTVLCTRSTLNVPTYDGCRWHCE